MRLPPWLPAGLMAGTAVIAVIGYWMLMLWAAADGLVNYLGLPGGVLLGLLLVLLGFWKPIVLVALATMGYYWGWPIPLIVLLAASPLVLWLVARRFALPGDRHSAFGFHRFIIRRQSPKSPGRDRHDDGGDDDVIDLSDQR